MVDGLLLAVTFLGLGVCLIMLVGVGVGLPEWGVCRGFSELGVAREFKGMGDFDPANLEFVFGDLDELAAVVLGVCCNVALPVLEGFCK